MIKKVLLILLFSSLAISACTPDKAVITLTSILTGGSGMWKIAYAKFGDEEAPRGMYDRFTIQFKNDGSYIVVNPDGSVAFTSALVGKWKEGTLANTIVFDGTVTIREIANVRTANKLTFEWEVSIPGKVTTTYRIELVKAS